jgi:hypothetical protein
LLNKIHTTEEVTEVTEVVVTVLPMVQVEVELEVKALMPVTTQPMVEELVAQEKLIQ